MATECASTLRCPQLSASSLQDEGGSPTKAHSTRARQEQEALLPGDMMLLASRRLCSARNQGANSPGPSARPCIHTQPLINPRVSGSPGLRGLHQQDASDSAPLRSPGGGRTACRRARCCAHRRRAQRRATNRGAAPCRAPRQARPTPLLRCAAFPALPPLLLASSTRPCADMAGAVIPACQQTGALHCAVPTTRTSSRPTAQRPSQQGNMRYARCLGLPGPLHGPNWPPHTSLAFPSTAGTACPAVAGGA